MKKIIFALALLLTVAFIPAVANAEVNNYKASTEYAIKAGLPAKVGLLACTYNPATLHGGQSFTVWSGGGGELVKVTNYIQRITSPDCGTSVRAATNWDCEKPAGTQSNCGAELGHYVEDGASNNYAITAYTCYTAGYACFSSSGADGLYTSYSAWFAPWFSSDFRGVLSVSQVSVAGHTSLSNHVSRSGWLYVA